MAQRNPYKLDESERHNDIVAAVFLVVFLLFRKARTSAARRGAARVILAQILAQCADLDIAASTEESQVSARIATKNGWNMFHVSLPSLLFVIFLWNWKRTVDFFIIIILRRGIAFLGG